MKKYIKYSRPKDTYCCYFFLINYLFICQKTSKKTMTKGEVYELHQHDRASSISTKARSDNTLDCKSLEYEDARSVISKHGAYKFHSKEGTPSDDRDYDDDDDDHNDDDNKDLETHKQKSKASLYHFAQFPNDLTFLLPGYATALISGVAKPIQTILLGKVYSAMSKYASGEYATSADFMHDVTVYSMSVVGLGGVLLFVNWIMLTCFDLFSASMLRRARRKMFVRFLNRDFAWYDTNKGIMGTLTSLNRCFSDVQSATSMTLALISQAVCTIIACLGISFYYSWSVALVSLSGLPVIVLVIAITSRFITLYFYNFKLIVEDASALVNWAINSIATVKQFNGQFFLTEKLSKKLRDGSIFYFKFSMVAGFQQGLSRFLVLSMFVPVFVFGAYQVRRGAVTSGDVLTVFSCSFMISGSVSTLGQRMESLNKGQVACARIKEFLDLGMSSVTYFKNMIGIFPEKCYGSIVFQKVSFFFWLFYFYLLGY